MSARQRRATASHRRRRRRPARCRWRRHRSRLAPRVRAPTSSPRITSRAGVDGQRPRMARDELERGAHVRHRVQGSRTQGSNRLCQRCSAAQSVVDGHPLIARLGEQFEELPDVRDAAARRPAPAMDDEHGRMDLPSGCANASSSSGVLPGAWRRRTPARRRRCSWPPDAAAAARIRAGLAAKTGQRDDQRLPHKPGRVSASVLLPHVAGQRDKAHGDEALFAVALAVLVITRISWSSSPTGMTSRAPTANCATSAGGT